MRPAASDTGEALDFPITALGGFVAEGAGDGVVGGFGAASTPVAQQSVSQVPAQDSRRHIYHGATVDFDFSEQKLMLSVPQKYMRNAARGYVPSRLHAPRTPVSSSTVTALGELYSSGRTPMTDLRGPSPICALIGRRPTGIHSGIAVMATTVVYPFRRRPPITFGDRAILESGGF